MDANGNAILGENGVARTDAATFAFRDLNNNLNLSQEKTITTLDITNNGEQATFSGIVDLGNGEFLTSMVQSQYKETDEGSGSSTGTVSYPDSVWVAAFDKDLNLKRIYRDD